MHPDMIQTIAAERSRSLQECATACRRAEEIRRSRWSPYPRPLARLTRAVSGLRLRAA